MADFKTAVLITLRPDHEGGYQNEVNDWANWEGGKPVMEQYLNTEDPVQRETLLVHLKGTKYGITAQDMPGVEIKDLTVDQAIQFYSERYWKPLYSQITSQLVANKLFDMGVLFGIGEAVKLLQIALRITPDSSFGPNTLAAVNQADETSLLSSFKTLLVSYTLRIALNNPEERSNVAGWGRRINF